MKKDKSSKVYSTDDADFENVVCEKSHLSATQSDNSACMNVVIRDQSSSKSVYSFNENTTYKNNSDVGLNSDELVSAITTKREKMDSLPSCTEKEQMKSFCSAGSSAKLLTGENDMEGQQSVDCNSHDIDKEAPQVDAPDRDQEVNKKLLASSQESEEDDADLEEQDVKVCDICGDAGREDLLAICSRCTDGAEHTYCMHEMLDEVPEGNWLCEECKSSEEMEQQRRGLGVRERSKRISDSLLEKKDHSLPGSRADSDSLIKHLTNKRPASDLEVDPPGKKQILESMVHSVNTSTSAKDGGLSRDNSFKDVDKMNAKLTHQTSFSGRDSLEKPRSPNANSFNTAKGSYLKSNSFGSSGLAPKVKMVVEIPQKHKQGVDVKDASSKILSKSMSSKGSLSRSNTIESKVKMLSPKDSHILESRGLQQAKDRNVFERKNSIKLESSSASQPAVNGFKNQQRGEGGVNSEKNLEKSSNLSRQGVGDGTVKSSTMESSSVRSLKDGLNEENKLKAAIQAAMQKRLDMSRKKGTHEAEAATPSSSLNCVTVKENNTDRSKVLRDDSLDFFQARNTDSLFSDVEQINRLRRSAIPEHEFAWIGSFEVYRGGTTSEQIFGIQAHLSTCASSKVLEMVKKFPQKVHLSEVPRSYMWPVQFQDGAAEEDNIAVYFFAKDIESYERSYKNLLEKLMKEDLALKGNIDGIDLLVFPSKQLMKRSQRWNMMSFIWGVFRSRKENCLVNNSGYVEKLDPSSLKTSKVVTSISPPEKLSLDGYVRGNISTKTCDQDISGHSAFESGVISAKEYRRSSSGDLCLVEHSLHKPNYSGGHQESRSESEYTCGRRSESTLVEEHSDPESVKVAACKTSCLPIVGVDSSDKVEMMSVDQSAAHEATSVGGSSENKTVAEVKFIGTMKEEDIPVDYSKVEANARQKIQCSEKEDYQAKAILDGEPKQEALVEKIDLGRSNSDCPSTDSQKWPLNGTNVAPGETAYSASAEPKRPYFPVDLNSCAPINSNDDPCSFSSMEASSESLRPNLELALGVENRSETGLFLGFIDDHRNPQSAGRRRKEDEESSAAALSLSLAFPEK